MRLKKAGRITGDMETRCEFNDADKMVYRTRFFLYWLGVAIYAVGIFILSSLSAPPSPPGTEGSASFPVFAHFLIYAVFSALILIALENSTRPRLVLNAPAITMIIASVYGALDEYHQHFVPGRTMTTEDFLIDCLGSVSTMFAVLIFRSLRNARK
jgi:VanZ family protein